MLLLAGPPSVVIQALASLSWLMLGEGLMCQDAEGTLRAGLLSYFLGGILDRKPPRVLDPV